MRMIIHNHAGTVSPKDSKRDITEELMHLSQSKLEDSGLCLNGFRMSLPLFPT